MQRNSVRPLQQNCHPDRSGGAVSPLPTHNSHLIHLSPLVIPTGAKRNGGICCSSDPTNNHNLSHPSSLVIPTGAKRGGGICSSSDPTNNHNLSHLSPLVIPTRAKRSGGICGAPCGSLKSFPARVPEQRIPINPNPISQCRGATDSSETGKQRPSWAK